MNNEELRAKVLDYLSHHSTMTVATAGDNQPWATTVFYANDDFSLYFLSNPGTSRHGRNLTANPRLSISITEDYPLKKLDDWRHIKGIQLEGTASLLATEEEINRAVETYVSKYPFVAPYLKSITAFPGVVSFLEKASRSLKFIPDFSASLENRFYKVTPSRVWFVDNETSFEQRQEVSF